MLDFIVNNLATILTGAVVCAITLLAVIKMIHNKKKGVTSCGCGCKGCPMSDVCHK